MSEPTTSLRERFELSYAEFLHAQDGYSDCESILATVRHLDELLRRKGTGALEYHEKDSLRGGVYHSGRRRSSSRGEASAYMDSLMEQFIATGFAKGSGQAGEIERDHN